MQAAEDRGQWIVHLRASVGRPLSVSLFRLQMQTCRMEAKPGGWVVTMPSEVWAFTVSVNSYIHQDHVVIGPPDDGTEKS
jgi:hypothetical protein